MDKKPSIKNAYILTEFRTRGVLRIPVQSQTSHEDVMRMVWNMGHLPIRELDEKEAKEYDDFVVQTQEEYISSMKKTGEEVINETSKN